MGLAVNDPGFFTTVQDRGRISRRSFGVPVGGPFDRASADLANALLNNPADAAVLEMTLRGGFYEADAPLALALAGAPMPATVDNDHEPPRPVVVPGSFTLRPGDRLSLGFARKGLRTYLAVRGGWRTPVVLGSRSSESPVRAGGVLPAVPGSTAVRYLEPTPEIGPPETPIRVVDGPDAPSDGPALWLPERAYKVLAESDRAGLRLEGPPLSLPGDPNRVSAPVAPGAIQVAGGQLLLLGVACGTMGGYPHVGHVIDADLDRVGQIRPGGRVRFARVSLEEARRIGRGDRDRRRAFRLRVAAAASD